MRTLRFLIHKEFLQIFRDRMLLGMLFIMPLAQLLLLANAATFEVRSARMYVVDQDGSPASRGVVDRLTASGRFINSASSASIALANEAMLGGATDVILVVPRHFERDLVRDQHAPVQFIVNAEDGGAAGVMQSYASRILAGYAAELSIKELPGNMMITGAPDVPVAGRATIDVRRRGWYNPDLDYADYMVPGILVIVVTVVGTLLTAMNIVREKEAGTLDQLNVTPIKRSTFIAAKLIPLWSLALLDFALGLLLAYFVLGVPIRGSLLVVFLGGAIYLVGALGIGLWISSISETQQQAMFVSFSILMTYLLMSGLFTPLRAMPEWAQWLAEANPLAHFTNLMRAVLLKGAGLRDLMHQFVMLTVIGLVVLTLAVRQYSKRTE